MTGKSQGDEDVFEVWAREYPPIFHAMMALSALIMACKNGSHDANALEHYQQAISALQMMLQNSQDSYSNGALLTHLLLLFYEITARESNMWQYHYDHLLRIFSMRRQAYSVDPFDNVGKLLQKIYEKPSDAVAQMGNANSVDWVDEMEWSGERFIMYGLWEQLVQYVRDIVVIAE
ncbi:hypothetical protein BKA65DRAFT_127589 [Rhexocercosporidium sp. MPI-PUGE-AT-0058]|nr:hypothetical protein BKA65DRAFT_127589 [Rhexocercosporidium sp. MPI-PUGE-AT-0058]